MKIEISEKELGFLIMGYQIPFGGLECAKGCPEKFENLTSFTGNGWNEAWGWDMGLVDEMDVKDKMELLEYMRKITKKEDNQIDEELKDL